MLVILLRASASDPRLAARLRPVIWMLLLAHLLAGAQRRGGPFPGGQPNPSARVPRRRVVSHASLTGRRPRG
jgi:hypothetical protein